MICNQCKNEIKNGAVFCPVCGATQNQHSPADTGTQYSAPGMSADTQNYANSEAGAQSGASNGSVGFAEAIKLMFVNYANFKGRASKSEFWYAYLFTFILNIVSGFIPYLGVIIPIVLIIPLMALSVRRLHDTGKSGLYYLFGLIPMFGTIIVIIWWASDSDGDNKWGPASASGRYTSNAAYTSDASFGGAYARTDEDIYRMSQYHEPIDTSTLEAKRVMDAAIARILPGYNGTEDPAAAFVRNDPQNIRNAVSAADTDTLIVIFKALGCYMERGSDAGILGKVRSSVLETLKKRG